MQFGGFIRANFREEFLVLAQGTAFFCAFIEGATGGKRLRQLLGKMRFKLLQVYVRVFVECLP